MVVGLHHFFEDHPASKFFLTDKDLDKAGCPSKKRDTLLLQTAFGV
jgi:hypothetical protein